MKKTVLIVMAVAGLVMLDSCGGKKQQQAEVPQENNDTVSVEELVPRDHTLYGICTGGTAMNTLEFVTDNGDTLALSTTKAQESGRVFGGLQVADRVAVVTDTVPGQAKIVINLNTLMGDWVMPDPIDGSSDIGIRLKEGGVAESIDQSVIIYRTWRIFNGDLDIQLVREGGGDEEEEIRFEILTLGADTLAIRTLNRPRDAVETFEYTRWKEKPKADLHGLKLEEHDDDFIKFM